MATNRIIQYLETGSGAAVSNRQQIETFRVDTSGGPVTLAKGDVMAFDLSQSDTSDKLLFVHKSDLANTQAFRAVGTCNAAYSFKQGEDAKVDLVVAGLCDILVNAGTTEGEGLVISAVPGQVDTYTAAAVTPYVATALETSVPGGVIKGIFLPQF